MQRWCTMKTIADLSRCRLREEKKDYAGSENTLHATATESVLPYNSDDQSYHVIRMTSLTM
eukprot:1161164-Pelagomonas_calceolata.AAC.5